MIVTDIMRRRRARRAMCRYANYLYTQRAEMSYAEVRPMRSFHTPFMTVPAHATDCSESTALVARGAIAPTPYVVDDEGYTGTQLATLPHIPFSETRRGDFAVFVAPERPTGDHVVMLLQGGRRKSDPLVWSHGRPGVDVMPLSKMKAGFPDHKTVYLKTVPDRYSKTAKTAARQA